MPYALDPQGRPIFLISNMAMHTQNVKADPRASLFIAQAAADGDPLGAARATLVGEVKPVSESDLAAAREAYLARHENSRYWVDFADFGFFRLELVDIYYVGGFGVMGWVKSPEYEEASPDPLAPAAVGIMAHMNADHVDAMILLARTHAGIEAKEASMTAVDRLGFHLRLRTAEGMKGGASTFPAKCELRRKPAKRSSKWYEKRTHPSELVEFAAAQDKFAPVKPAPFPKEITANPNSMSSMVV
jgi:putative heme iron utilization protein